ncbi:homocitrate synthase NifV [Ruminiclostridium sufflavum DSM 19573]|uniref:Homocitrate synthase NifV n=1 Tax=Ruminiclostridium sufflavum DSM 19573 TaxID=1121337 RepID=A0A318XJU9_9FIRM|nr:isopropylmalate synthase [Ruminiclostridium sufflavum]PYG84826.1 homocitrate synthase NifV [Ruminiclostridium sufflavum DSM 19573]
MIKITDVTLCSLNNEAAQNKNVPELYGLLFKTGINFVEINVPVYESIKENVDKRNTILRVQDPTEIKYYPGFSRYICRHSGFFTRLETISEIQINDIREIKLMNKFNEYHNIRIVGLDDLLQHDYISAFDRIKKINSGALELCPQNSCYCASALAVEWILNGGSSVAVSFSGNGGFAALEEVVMALRITKRHKPNLDLSVFVQIKNLFEEITEKKILKNKPVIGNGIFDVESGIHVDGIFKNGSNYEPFEPSVVGMKRKIVIGKHSGSTAIEMKLKEYNINFPDNRFSELLASIQEECIRLRRSITDQEFVAFAKELIQ